MALKLGVLEKTPSFAEAVDLKMLGAFEVAVESLHGSCHSAKRGCSDQVIGKIALPGCRRECGSDIGGRFTEKATVIQYLSKGRQDIRLGKQTAKYPSRLNQNDLRQIDRLSPPLTCLQLFAHNGELLAIVFQ